jgi:AcrR family transcriptional regulator
MRRGQRRLRPAEAHGFALPITAAMTSPRPTVRRQTADQRREAVLDAATTAFAAKGLYGTTTEEIARRAGISQPYVFRLFGSKMNLFIAVLTRVLLTADQHDRHAEDRSQRVLLHALAARDEPRIRAQLLAARVSHQGYDVPGGLSHAALRAIVLRFATDPACSHDSPARTGNSAPHSSGWSRTE